MHSSNACIKIPSIEYFYIANKSKDQFIKASYPTYIAIIIHTPFKRHLPLNYLLSSIVFTNFLKFFNYEIEMMKIYYKIRNLIFQQKLRPFAQKKKKEKIAVQKKILSQDFIPRIRNYYIFSIENRKRNVKSGEF